MRALALIALAGCTPDAAPPPTSAAAPIALGPVGCLGCGDLTTPPSCSGQTDPVVMPGSSGYTGTTVGLNFDTSPPCGEPGLQRPDRELQIDLPDTLSFDAYLFSGSFEHGALDVGRCDGPPGPGSCNTDEVDVGSGDAYWQLNHAPAGRYYIVVSRTLFEPATPFILALWGVIQPNGRCDVPLAVAGDLTCAPGTSCNGTHCVSGSFECGDGIDNDGDGKSGYPSDPGCTSITDPSELDDCPAGPNCAACANLTDEDGDGHAGFPTDPGCTSPGDLDEFDPCPDGPINCPACANQIDDDGDGEIDMADPACPFAARDYELPKG